MGISNTEPGVFRKNLYPMLVLMTIPARDTHLVQQATASWCRLRTFISFTRKQNRAPKETNQRKGHHQIKRALLSPFAQFLLNFIQENASIKASNAHRHAFGGHPRAYLLKTNVSLLATIFLNIPDTEQGISNIEVNPLLTCNL